MRLHDSVKIVACALLAPALLVTTGCPGSGADAGSLCGNDIIDPGEQCDPPDGTTCDSSCMSLGSVCGNGVLELGEMCDPPGTACGDGTVCNVNCQCGAMKVGNAVGEACVTSAECAGFGALVTTCWDEMTWGMPGGYCTLQSCAASSDCPAGSICVAIATAMGTQNYCLAECTPDPASNGGCRADSAGGIVAYGCLPLLTDATTGVCFQGCESDMFCNFCTPSGTCFNDSSIACTTDAECMAGPTAEVCDTTINLCYESHPSGPAGIGEPCSVDADCPSNAACATAGPFFPGGHCTTVGCGSYGSLPGFQCDASGVCPAASIGIVNYCTAGCTTDTADPSGECDADRGDDQDYVCMELDAAATSAAELFDQSGQPGACMQCDAFFTLGCPTP